MNITQPELESITITCPECGHHEVVVEIWGTVPIFGRGLIKVEEAVISIDEKDEKAECPQCGYTGHFYEFKAANPRPTPEVPSWS